MVNEARKAQKEERKAQKARRKELAKASREYEGRRASRKRNKR